MPEAAICVTVAFSPAAREVLEWTVTLPAGATLRQAIMASGLPEAFPSMVLEQSNAGVWGRKAAWDHILQDRDRVEVYRQLLVDPKVARRARFRKQGARAAGLFATKKPGAKPGY